MGSDANRMYPSEKPIILASEATLRDMFAAKAMQSLVTKAHLKVEWSKEIKQIPGIAYEIADAMLAEREKKNEK